MEFVNTSEIDLRHRALYLIDTPAFVSLKFYELTPLLGIIDKKREALKPLAQLAVVALPRCALVGAAARRMYFRFTIPQTITKTHDPAKRRSIMFYTAVISQNYDSLEIADINFSTLLNDVPQMPLNTGLLLRSK